MKSKSMNHNIKWSFNIFVFFYVLTYFIPFVFAQNASKPESKARGGEGFGVSPPYLKLEAQPGETLNTFITLDNTGPKNTTFTITMHGTIIDNQNPKDAVISSLPPAHIARNMEIEATKFILPPHSTKSVQITIKVAETLKGSHYAVLTVSKLLNQAISKDIDAPKIEKLREGEIQKSVGVGFIPAMGISIRVNVLGTLKYSHNIPKLHIEPQTESNPLKIRAFVENTGNAEFNLPFMLILLKHSPNKKSRTVVARTKTEHIVTVLPGTSKVIDFKPILRKIEPGTYQAVISAVSQNIVLQPVTKEVTIP